MSLNQTVKMQTNKYYSDPTHNRTQKNMSSNVFKMGKAFKKLNVEQKNYNIFMQTMKFLCHKLQIGRQEARLTNSEENALNKVALQLEKQFKNANMKFNSTAFKSLFKRTAKSLEESHNLKKKMAGGKMAGGKMAGGNPKRGSSEEDNGKQMVLYEEDEDEAQMVVYEEMPLVAQNQSVVYRWFSNAISLRMNTEKLDILSLLSLFLGMFQLWCAWQTLSSLALTFSGSSAGEVTSGFSSFIITEISNSGFYELFTFGFIGNSFNRVFSNQLEFLQNSLISQIGEVSGVVSSSIQTTCFSHLLEQSAWTRLADMMVAGNLEVQLRCINDVTIIEGDRALSNIRADFALVNTKFKKDSQLVLNQVWTGVWYIRGSLGWLSYRLGYQGIAQNLFNMGHTMRKIRPGRRSRMARPGEIVEIPDSPRSNSSSRRRRAIENAPSSGVENSLVTYLNQPPRRSSSNSSNKSNDVGF
jgi:hypothetical protein